MYARRLVAVGIAGLLLVSVGVQAELENLEEFHGDDIALMATASSITASGSLGKPPESCTLKLEYHRADPKVSHRALLVFAEPSHTLLFVLWNGDLDDPDFDENEYREFLAAYEALASSVGMHGSSHPRLHVIYDPNGDTHVRGEDPG